MLLGKRHDGRIEDKQPRADGWVGIGVELEGARGQAKFRRWGWSRNLDFKWPT